ncbi:MAG: hypothetical protein ACK5PJ_00705, partial [Ralstonia sp.]
RPRRIVDSDRKLTIWLSDTRRAIAVSLTQSEADSGFDAETTGPWLTEPSDEASVDDFDESLTVLWGHSLTSVATLSTFLDLSSSLLAL